MSGLLHLCNAHNWATVMAKKKMYAVGEDILLLAWKRKERARTSGSRMDLGWILAAPPPKIEVNDGETPSPGPAAHLPTCLADAWRDPVRSSANRSP